MCVLSIKVPIRKKSGNLSYTPRISTTPFNEIIWKGQEFHMCTINKSAHTEKSLETYLMILVYIFKRIIILKQLQHQIIVFNTNKFDGFMYSYLILIISVVDSSFELLLYQFSAFDYYCYLLLRVFHISVSWWSFTGDWVTASLLKSPQVSRTLFSILDVFNTVVVWMVSTRLPTSKSSRLFNNPLVTVPKAPITIGIIVTFIFHSFFNSLARSRYF